MGLKADIDEVVDHWTHAPWRVKVFLAVALFISSSSLASLSESVFRWKGFLLEALAFYRVYVSDPASRFITDLVGRSLPSNYIDGAVLLGLFHGALIRALLLRHVSVARRIGDVLTFAGTYCAMLFIMAQQPDKPTESSVWVLYPAFLLAAYMLTRGAERILAVSYMLVPVVTVALLAAISSGLQK